MAAYGTAIAHARLLELDDVVSLLEQTLEEEKAADKKLTEVAESVVNLDAASSESDEQTATARRSGRAISTVSSRARASAADRHRSGNRSRRRR